MTRSGVRHPVAAVAAGSTAAVCMGTPWLLEPPMEVRITAGFLAGLTSWLAVRGLGALAGVVVAVLRGNAPARRPVLGVAALLLLAGCAGVARPDRAPPLTASDVLPLTGSTAGPVRIQVPMSAAATDDGRARVAVADLARAGGFARSTVLVAVPTGSGWLDWAAVAALERQTGGDVATVTVQYADVPSWVEYLAGGDRAERSAVRLLAAVRAQLASLPAATRPRLMIFGESLGATAAVAAVHEVGPVDGCVLAGRPGSAGTPHVPGCVDVRNVDDPVGWWRPGLLVTPRAGLPWLPVSTFWQVTGALVVSLGQPAGHGHRYGAGVGPAWSAVLRHGRPGST